MREPYQSRQRLGVRATAALPRSSWGQSMVLCYFSFYGGSRYTNEPASVPAAHPSWPQPALPVRLRQKCRYSLPRLHSSCLPVPPSTGFGNYAGRRAHPDTAPDPANYGSQLQGRVVAERPDANSPAFQRRVPSANIIKSRRDGRRLNEINALRERCAVHSTAPVRRNAHGRPTWR